MKAEEKQALAEWKQLLKDIRNSTPTEHLSPAEVERRRVELEKDPIEWMSFFFQSMPSIHLPIFKERPSIV